MKQVRVEHGDPRLLELLPSAFTPAELAALECSYAAHELSPWVFLDEEWRDPDSAKQLAAGETLDALRERESHFLRVANWHLTLDHQDAAIPFVVCACNIRRSINEMEAVEHGTE